MHGGPGALHAFQGQVVDPGQDQHDGEEGQEPAEQHPQRRGAQAERREDDLGELEQYESHGGVRGSRAHHAPLT